VPSDRLTAAQQARIAKAAEAFVAERDLVHRPSRYDVIEVIPRRGHAPFVRHYRGAFMPEV
jgi:Holliday junction resolvase-like predicted endonuclease